MADKTNKSSPPKGAKPRPKTSLVDVLDDLDAPFEIVAADGHPTLKGSRVRCLTCGETIKATGPTGHGDIRRHADEHLERGSLGDTLRKGETITIDGADLLRNGKGLVLTPDDIDAALEEARNTVGTSKGKGTAKSLVVGADGAAPITRLPPTPPRPERRASNARPAKGKIPTPVNPWDRQTNEAAAPWEAFIVYRDLGLTRSHVKVADELGKSVQLIARWAKAHTWAIRVAAYDSEADREWQLEMRQQRRLSAQRNAAIANRALELVAARLEQAFQLDAGDVARLMSEASKLERLALGLSTENVELTGRNGGPVETIDHTLLTDEERLERLKSLRREIDSRLESEGITA